MKGYLHRTLTALAVSVLVAHVSAAAAADAGEQSETAPPGSRQDGGMVWLTSFAIDRYEYPNTAGAMPRVNVSWHQARELCAARGKRLCTESEWQLAASGTGNLRYGYGNAFESGRCNAPALIGGVWERSAGTAPSGAFGRCCSEFGVYDMVGNVWEWTATPAPAHPEWRVVRGGSWFHNANMARVDGRYSRHLTPDYELDLIGFRCCQDVAPEAGD